MIEKKKPIIKQESKVKKMAICSLQAYRKLIVSELRHHEEIKGVGISPN